MLTRFLSGLPLFVSRLSLTVRRATPQDEGTDYGGWRAEIWYGIRASCSRS